MNLFDKKLDGINESDLKKMEADPVNFESLQLEYKIIVDSDNYTDIIVIVLQYLQFITTFIY